MGAAGVDCAATAVSHEFKPDDNLPRWHGLARIRARPQRTLRYGLGIDDVMAQRILRHKDVQITRDHYIKTSREQAIAAMARLESALSPLCVDRALNALAAKHTLPC